MRALIVTDVHANAAALRAVLDTPEAKRCERVYSLGDQVNFGAEPAEVLRLLRQAEAVCLLGNHEERLRHITDPAFQGYNWRLLHWTHAQLPKERFDDPVDVRLGPVLLTHGTQGDPWHLLHEKDVAAALDELPPDVRYMISGHNHTCWRVAQRGRVAVNPGSVGLMELDGAGSMAPFATVEVRGNDAEICTYSTYYDVKEAAKAYLESGAAACAPEMCRAVLTTMRTGVPMYVTRLMRHVSAVAQQHGLQPGDEQAWKLADRSFEWAEQGTSDDFWKEQERELDE